MQNTSAPADEDEPRSYRDVAKDLIGEYGWPRAAFVATAVRGFVYGLPSPSPYKDKAEAIYEELGWEQAALLAAWFRNLDNQPADRWRNP